MNFRGASGRSSCADEAGRDELEERAGAARVLPHAVPATGASRFVARHSFAIARHCPVVGHKVALSGLEMALADGSSEIVKKTCFRFSECYKNRAGEPATGNIVPHPGCLLGDPGI